MARPLLLTDNISARFRVRRMLAFAALLPGLSACALLSSMTTSAAPAGSESQPSAGGAPEPQTESASVPSPPEPPAASAPEPPKPVSVTLRNTCGETVKVLFGDKPKFGSGTDSSLSGNSSTSHSFMPGDVFWIVDDSNNGVSSFTVAAGTGRIEVQSGCASLSGG